jgi:hypothetical protein
MTSYIATQISSLSGYLLPGSDVANTLNNFWLSGILGPIIRFKMWDITFIPNPFTVLNEKNMLAPAGYNSSQGLTAKDNNTLITTNTNVSPNQVVEVTNFVNGGTVTITPQFSLTGSSGASRIIDGDLLYTNTGKLIVITRGTSDNNKYIAQYDYANKVLESEVMYTATTNSFTSIFESGGDIYLIEQMTSTETSNLYRYIGAPSYLEFKASIPLWVVGATTDFNCNDVDLYYP